MALYEVAVATPAAAAGAAYCDIRTAAGARAEIREIGAVCNAATASAIGLIRPATVGTATTTTAGQPEDPADTAATAVIGTAWSSAPTIGTIYLRRFGTAAQIGAGIVWSWWAARRGLIIPISSSVILWNYGGGAGSVLQVWAVWEE
jgi:hypothetical protein